MNIPGLTAKTLIAQERAKAKLAYVDWFRGQGAKIKAARPPRVFAACVLMALELSATRNPLILKAEEIAMCEERAVSAARAQRHGPIPRQAEEWQRQVAEIRMEWQIQTGAA